MENGCAKNSLASILHEVYDDNKHIYWRAISSFVRLQVPSEGVSKTVRSSEGKGKMFTVAAVVR